MGAPSYQLFFMLLFFVFFIVPYFVMAVLPHVEWTLTDMFYGDKFAKYFWKGKESLFSGAPVCYWWMLLKWLYSNVLIWKPLFWELSFLKPTGIYVTIVWSKKRTYCSSSLSVLILILPLMSQTKVFWFVLMWKLPQFWQSDICRNICQNVFFLTFHKCFWKIPFGWKYFQWIS